MALTIGTAAQLLQPTLARQQQQQQALDLLRRKAPTENERLRVERLARFLEAIERHNAAKPGRRKS